MYMASFSWWRGRHYSALSLNTCLLLVQMQTSHKYDLPDGKEMWFNPACGVTEREKRNIETHRSLPWTWGRGSRPYWASPLSCQCRHLAVVVVLRRWLSQSQFAVHVEEDRKLIEWSLKVCIMKINEETSHSLPWTETFQSVRLHMIIIKSPRTFSNVFFLQNVNS